MALAVVSPVPVRSLPSMKAIGRSLAVVALVLAMFSVAATPIADAVPDKAAAAIDLVIPDNIQDLFGSSDASAAWWNPFSWSWGTLWNKVVKPCGVGAAVALVGKSVATVSTNTMLTLAKKNLVKVAGGGYAYIGWGVAGCIIGIINQ